MNIETVHRAVLLTDLVDSASLNEALGDIEFAQIMIRLEQIIRSLIRENHGREIDKTDGFLIVFERPIDAMGFALSLNESVAGLTPGQPMPLKMRTGLHYGTLVLRKNSPEDVAEGAKAVDADGLTKVVAARLTALAEPGQVLITRTLFDLVRQDELAPERVRADALWLAHGSYLLQGLNDPVEIFEVGYPGAAPLAPPSDKGKARRAILPQDEYALGWRPANGQAIPTAPDYTVVRKLGEGGYGEVWLAENKQTGERRVFKFCFDPARMRSLNREKLLLTILQENLGDRDDIVRILDWNATEAPYFIALAYIPKDNLLTYLDKRPPGQPLAAQTVLKVIRKAAVALEAAHSVGVLHKDIKPSNLLIGGDDDDPDVHLIDFGIGLYNKPDDGGARPDAGVTPGSDHTTLRTSSFSGSRMYIAPEVIEGKPPTVQADLFSLGVLLYQLLRNDRETGLKVGWERDITDPFLVELIAGATDGDLEKRLRSVSAFVTQIDSLEQRRNEASLAEHEKLRRKNVEKALEAQKRRRRFYVAALAIAIPLSLVSVVFAFRSVQASKIADAKAAEATQARSKGNQLISFMLEDLTRELQLAGQLPLMDSVTSQTLKYYEDESTSSLTKEELFNRGRAMWNLGEIFFARNEMDSAGLSYNRSAVIAENLIAADKTNEKYAVLYADATQGKALVKYRTRDFADMNSLYEKAYYIRKSTYEKQPTDLDTAKKYANSCHHAGYIFRKTTGTQLAYDGIRVTSGMITMFNDPAEAKFWCGVSAYSLARISQNSSESRRAIKEAMSVFEEAQKINPKNYQVKEHLLKAYAYYGKTYAYDPREQSFEKLQKGAELVDKLLDKDYSNSEWRRLSAKCLYQYVVGLQAREHFADAGRYCQKAANLLDDMILANPNDHLLWDDYMGNRLAVHETLGLANRFDEAKKEINQTKTTIRQMLEKEPNLIQFLVNYSQIAYEESALERTPFQLAEAVQFIKKTDTETSVSFRAPLVKYLKTCDRILEEWAVVKPSECDWEPNLELATSSSIADHPFFLYLDNNTSEVMTTEIYREGSLIPYQRSFLPPKTRLNVTRTHNLKMGVSINGSPIMPIEMLYGQATGSMRTQTYLIIDLGNWIKEWGFKTRYRIPYDRPDKGMLIAIN